MGEGGGGGGWASESKWNTSILSHHFYKGNICCLPVGFPDLCKNPSNTESNQILI